MKGKVEAVIVGSGVNVNSFQDDIEAIGKIAAVPSILQVICRTTGMGFAAVARVTEDRWVACGVRDEIDFGLAPGGELEIETTICREIRQSGQSVAFDNAGEHPIYSTHHTPLKYGIQSYISVPIFMSDQTFFGTLCAIDPNPARVNTSETLEMFRLFAELIAFHYEAIKQVAANDSLLKTAEETAAFRDQFIAVLGHDLRNPLGAIVSGAVLLQHTPLSDRGVQIVAMIQKSADRINELISNVLDFARGRLGAGLVLSPENGAMMQPALDQVISELRSTWPGRVIEVSYDFKAPVYADTSRISQLFSNLLANALAHGTPDAPVRVRALSDETQFLLSVANHGQPIPAANLERLFQPFARGEKNAYQDGLGLGLYISSEIARAHGGGLEVASDEAETVFTLKIPSGL